MADISGRPKEYDHVLKVGVTPTQKEFLNAVAELQNVSKAEVVRLMIDAAYPYSLVQYVDTKEK